MRAPKSKLANFLSLNQHRKRLAAAKVASQLQQADWQKISRQSSRKTYREPCVLI